jgi:hypothetical protein
MTVKNSNIKTKREADRKTETAKQTKYRKTDGKLETMKETNK